VVTATNTAGSNTAESTQTSAIAETAPTNATAPVVSGTATIGQTLSTTNGTWNSISTPTYAYQWQRNGVDISGATSSTYTLVEADYNNPIRCEVTATNTAGNASANSNATANVAEVAPVNTVLPAITGTENEGQTLTCSSGTWTSASTETYAYQWERAGTAISGATSSTYTLVTADVGNTLTCVVTATNTAGSTDAESAATGTIAAPPSGPSAVVVTATGTTTGWGTRGIEATTTMTGAGQFDFYITSAGATSNEFLCVGVIEGTVSNNKDYTTYDYSVIQLGSGSLRMYEGATWIGSTTFGVGLNKKLSIKRDGSNNVDLLVDDVFWASYPSASGGGDWTAVATAFDGGPEFDKAAYNGGTLLSWTNATSMSAVETP